MPELHCYAKSDLKADTMGSHVMQNLYMLAGETKEVLGRTLKCPFVSQLKTKTLIEED